MSGQKVAIGDQPLSLSEKIASAPGVKSSSVSLGDRVWQAGDPSVIDQIWQESQNQKIACESVYSGINGNSAVSARTAYLTGGSVEKRAGEVGVGENRLCAAVQRNFMEKVAERAAKEQGVAGMRLPDGNTLRGHSLTLIKTALGTVQQAGPVALAQPVQHAQRVATPQPSVPNQQGAQQFMAQQPGMAGSGQLNNGLASRVSNQAANLPGMAGSAAANPLDTYGALSNSPNAPVDGNSALGAPTGFKIGSLRNKVGLIPELQKEAVVVEVSPRETRPVHSLMERVVYDDKELQAPTKADVPAWQAIGDAMTAARPYQLNDAKVYGNRFNTAEMANRVADRQVEDSFLDRVQGTRDELAAAFASTPDRSTEHLGSMYLPHANAVLVQKKSPGVLMHELGHAIDLAPRKGESKLWRYLRRNWKPTLWKEVDAWKKGRKAYQEGFAASPESETAEGKAQYAKNMESYNARKYPAFGTYVGAAGGGLAGAGAGLAALYALVRSMDHVPRQAGLLPWLGAAGGGALGIAGGAQLGSWWGRMRARANKRKALRQLEKAKQNPMLQDIATRLQQLREDRKKPLYAKKEPNTRRSAPLTLKAAGSVASKSPWASQDVRLAKLKKRRDPDAISTNPVDIALRASSGK